MCMQFIGHGEGNLTMKKGHRFLKNYRVDTIYDITVSYKKVEGKTPITIPKHAPIKKVYVQIVEEIVEDTIEAVVANAKDAKRAWLEAALEEELLIPEPDDTDKYSGQFKLRLPKSLHRQLAEHSKREGVSMNQYCVYLLSKNER